MIFGFFAEHEIHELSTASAMLQNSLGCVEKVQAVSLNIYLLSRSCTSIVRLEDGIFPNRVCWNGPPFQRARISTRRQCVWKTLRANLVVVAGNTAVAEHKFPKKHGYLHGLHYVTIYPNRTPTHAGLKSCAMGRDQNKRQTNRACYLFPPT